MSKLKFLNLTPHDVNYHHKDGTIEIIPSTGRVYVVPETREPYSFEGYTVVERSLRPTISGIPSIGEDEEIPALIVSRYAAALVRDLWPGEVFVPDTSSVSVIRDKSYRIVGIKRWERWSGDD